MWTDCKKKLISSENEKEVAWGLFETIDRSSTFTYKLSLSQLKCIYQMFSNYLQNCKLHFAHKVYMHKQPARRMHSHGYITLNRVSECIGKPKAGSWFLCFTLIRTSVFNWSGKSVFLIRTKLFLNINFKQILFQQSLWHLRCWQFLFIYFKLNCFISCWV